MTQANTLELSEDGVRQDYRELWGTTLPKLLAERRRALWTAAAWSALGLAVAAPLAYGSFTGFAGASETVREIMMAGALFAGVGGFVFGSRPLKKVHEKVKRTVVGGICEHLGLDYALDAGGFPKDVFRERDLVPNYDRSSFEDRIRGQWRGARMDAVDAHLKKRVRTGKHTSYRTVFRGLLVVCDFDKPFRGMTVVTKDRTVIGNFFGKLTRDGDRVALESPDFEKLYEVYSDDQVEARYILTPGFMERLMELQRVLGKTPTLGFVERQLYLVLPMDSDSFEAGGLFADYSDPEIGAETWAQFFLKYVVSHPAVTAAIPGTTNPTHARDNLAAATLPLPDP
ncbi:MAG: DUF3137 domain-containing protein, partial [Rhodovibrionaceae bacterium]|nr:DUF3137 domain-containing protein [Rhodovibrionaceae bacterium]